MPSVVAFGRTPFGTLCARLKPASPEKQCAHHTERLFRKCKSRERLSLQKGMTFIVSAQGFWSVFADAGNPSENLTPLTSERKKRPSKFLQTARNTQKKWKSVSNLRPDLGLIYNSRLLRNKQTKLDALELARARETSHWQVLKETKGPLLLRGRWPVQLIFKQTISGFWKPPWRFWNYNLFAFSSRNCSLRMCKRQVRNDLRSDHAWVFVLNKQSSILKKKCCLLFVQ